MGIEASGVSATQRETTQTNEFIPYLYLLVNTVILDQSRRAQSMKPVIGIIDVNQYSRYQLIDY